MTFLTSLPPVFALMFTVLGVAFLFATMVAIRDVFFQRTHAIQHNFPVVGHLRYLLEEIGPELRQYWVANDKEETPFNRSERRWVYASSKGQNKNFGFGSTETMDEVGYPIIQPSAFPFDAKTAPVLDEDPTLLPCLKVIGPQRKRPWRPMSIVNVSAMSYGSLGRNAVAAINRGCADARAFHNSGEGGFSEHHDHGADVVWQLGTGYFGARNPDGTLCLQRLRDKVQQHTCIRAVEIKLSQGAKPGKGGILPGAKVTPEIARIRGVPAGEDCVSPNTHSAFSDVDGLLDVIEAVADATGLPVGIKSAVGQLTFWKQLAERMKARGVGPDMIQVDGGEGGTGAAPLAFSDHVALPFRVGFSRVFPLFSEAGLADGIVWIGSGKVGFPDRAVVALAMGCDMIAVAREAMMGIGCIQAQKCHTGFCPTGIATHGAWLQRGLDVDDKSARLARFIRGLRTEMRDLAFAAGYAHPAQLATDDVEVCVGPNAFAPLSSVLGYTRAPVPYTTIHDYGPLDGSPLRTPPSAG